MLFWTLGYIGLHGKHFFRNYVVIAFKNFKTSQTFFQRVIYTNECMACWPMVSGKQGRKIMKIKRMKAMPRYYILVMYSLKLADWFFSINLLAVDDRNQSKKIENKTLDWLLLFNIISPPIQMLLCTFHCHLCSYCFNEFQSYDINRNQWEIICPYMVGKRLKTLKINPFQLNNQSVNIWFSHFNK